MGKAFTTEDRARTKYEKIAFALLRITLCPRWCALPIDARARYRLALRSADWDQRIPLGCFGVRDVCGRPAVRSWMKRSGIQESPCRHCGLLDDLPLSPGPSPPRRAGARIRPSRNRVPATALHPGYDAGRRQRRHGLRKPTRGSTDPSRLKRSASPVSCAGINGQSVHRRGHRVTQRRAKAIFSYFVQLCVFWG